MNLLRVRWGRRDLGRVAEELLVEDDGTAWLWSTRPGAASRIDRAGTYRATLADALLGRVRALAAGGPDGPPARDGTAAAGHGEPSGGAVAFLGPDERRLDLAQAGVGSGGLAAVVDEVRAAALAAPAAVVAVSWRPAGELAAGGRVTLLATFSSVGHEPVTIAVGARDLRWVETETGADWHAPSPETPIDLVGPSGELLGGAVGPARIPAGSRATVALVGVPVPGRPGAAAVHLAFSGRIALRGPVPREIDPADLALLAALPGDPDREVAIASAPVEVVVRP